jgi:nicotinate-nucleotide adenylyltransferase
MSDQVRQQLNAIPHSPLLTSFSELRGKVGIFGGSFDPLHNAHLELARSLKDKHSLDAVVFVPTGQNPLKGRQTIATPRQRVEMVAEALRGEDGMFVAPLQARRYGPSYTIDMIDSIRAELPAEKATLFLIMGADCVEQLPHWRGHERLLNEVELLPCSRGSQENRHDANSLFASLAPTLGKEAARKATLNFTEIGAGNESSTVIRKQLRQGIPATGLPPSVARMIERAGLYREIEGE